jgi:hypothetical protein
MRKILFIGGSLNQTRMVHAVSKHLQDRYDCYFTSFYSDGLMQGLSERGWLDFTALGGKHLKQSDAYLRQHQLRLDIGGKRNDYDLVVTASDLVIQKNIRDKPIILIQEGITDPITWRFHLVRNLGLPRYLAGTAANGLSGAYRYFCVASEGYKKFFVRNGADPNKILVTGIPNFDNARSFLENDFPHRNYALVATSCIRETFRYDDRKAFIRSAIAKAQSRPLIFKLHPNEKIERAVREIKSLAPDALIFTEGNIEPMIANCDVLITQYSTVSYLGLALGKEVHSYFNLDELRNLAPIQNGGASSLHIAGVCLHVLEADGTGVLSKPVNASVLNEKSVVVQLG